MTAIKSTGTTLGEADEHLFGANLDLTSDLPQAVASERLRNPTFCGPAEPGTGLAPHWKKLLEFSGGYYFMLEPGHNRVGGPGQRMQVTHGDGWLVQPRCWVRQGETLRIRLWVRCQEGAPVTLRVGFRHRGLSGPWYGQADIVVNRSYFAPYDCEVRISAGDDDCLFGCQMNQPGIVYFDRISVHSTAEGGTRGDTLEAMRELSVPDLRWPSGCTSTGYHWQRGVGPEDERHDAADPVFHWGMNYTWGTDEYLELCTELGIRPHLIANVGTGTPREAAEWAAYCVDWYRRRDLDPPEMVWQIGNEHYGTHEIGHMDSEQYADCLIDYAPGIRAAYPNAIICTTSLGENQVEPILVRAREHADLIAVHHYACRVDFNPAREALAFVGDAHAYARGLDQLAAKVKASGSHAGLAVTEWGAFRGEAHTDAKFCEPVDAGRMLFVTAMLNEYARRGRYLKLANFYSLINFMPAIIGRGPNVERTLKHDIFRFWRPLFPADIRGIETDGSTFAVPQSENGPAADCDPDKNPGGMLFQCGVHALHELMFLFGPISAVYAEMRADVHTTQTADVAHCILTFASGLIGTLSTYHVTPYRHTFNLYGTKRNLYLDARAPSYGDHSVVITQERKCCQAEKHEPLEIKQGKTDPCGNLKSFYRAVREGGAPYPSLKDGARAVLAVFAADKAFKTGHRQTVPTLNRGER